METCIPLPTISREQFQDAAPKQGLKVFPYVTGSWKSYTAAVTDISIQQGREVDYLVIKGANAQYGIRISAQLDPAFVPYDYGQDKDQQIERNTEKLVKILRAFDLARFDEDGKGVWLLPEKFPQAVGAVFSFSIKGADVDGQPKYNERGYPVTFASFRGAAPELLPVTVPWNSMQDRPVNTCSTNCSTHVPDDDLIPF